MTRSQRSRRQKKDQHRKSIAKEGQERFISMLNEPQNTDTRILKSSAKHLVRLSRRNRLAIPSKARHLICRKCSTPYRFGQNARVRIKHGQRIITCFECSSVRRFGGGPKSHRRQ